MFSVIYGVVFRSLPYEKSDQLVMIFRGDQSSGDKHYVSAPVYCQWNEQQDSFEEIAAFRRFRFPIRNAEGLISFADGARVSSVLFSIMRVQPLLGRTFSAAEETPGKNQVAVISYRYWKSGFGSSSDVLGRTLLVDNQLASIVGVMPEGFHFPKETDIWLPVNLNPNEPFNSPENNYYSVIGRLKPTISLQQAQDNMNILRAQIAKAHSEIGHSQYIWLDTLLNQTVGNLKPTLYSLLGAVGFVLLIACLNVANVLIAKSAARDREFAIRGAFGATRSRMISQLLTEGVLLATVGGMLGLLLAYWSLDVVKWLCAEHLPRVESVRLDFRVLGFTGLVILATGLFFGLAPALSVSKRDISISLYGRSRNVTRGIRRQRLRSAFAIGQVALALVLLIGAGLLLRSFLNLQNPTLGFDPDRMLMVGVYNSDFVSDSEGKVFFDQVKTRLESVPDIKKVSYSNLMLYSDSSSAMIVIPEKADDRSSPARGIANIEIVSPDYFECLRLPLLRGRAFAIQDGTDTQAAAIINEALANRYWPSEDPIGHQVEVFGFGEKRTIIGIVGTRKDSIFSSSSRGTCYLPLAQCPKTTGALLIRTGSNPTDAKPLVKDVIQDTLRSHNRFAFLYIRTLNEVLASSFKLPSLVMKLTSVFAAVALGIAAMGLFAVMSLHVVQRTREIGIRMALGAQPKSIFELIIGHGLALTAIGLAIGIFAAFGLTRFVRSMLVEITPIDFATYSAVAALLLAVALLACYVPARWAAKTDPMTVLRYE